MRNFNLVNYYITIVKYICIMESNSSYRCTLHILKHIGSELTDRVEQKNI